MKTSSFDSQRSRGTWARIVGGLALAGAVLVASPVSAADPDTVFLTNGGRLRGTVMVDDPGGVSVRLADGTTRKLTRGEVTRVEYAADAAAAAPVPAPPVAPAAAAPAPAAPPAVAAAAPTPAMAAQPFAFAGAPGESDAPVSRRRSTGLMVTGLVLMPVGAIALGTGIGLAVAGSDGGSCDNYGYGYSYSCGGEDDGMVAGGAATAVVGGVLLATGIVFTAVGASKKRVGPEVSLSQRGIQVAGRF